MANVVVIGSQWGDEGKGKIVDWLAEKADIVVRFQGGHNAGHTLVIGKSIYKLHLLPSGIVREGKLSIIGNGVVVDPWALLGEIETVRGQGVDITPASLVLAENAPLILPLHRHLDQALEAARGKNKIGTTGRGIGPAYEDNVGRRAIRVCDLAHPQTLPDKIDKLLFFHNALLKGLGAQAVDGKLLLDSLLTVAPRILPYARSAAHVLEAEMNKGRRILFEGAQGIMLDVNHGTYPYVTSSNTHPAQAAMGSGGLGPSALDFVLGITKAYTTRVGEGPFPTELKDADGEKLGERGHEFGTTTGRKRRCGWFDAVQVRHAVKIAGINGIALTKLDVLDAFDEIKIATAYDIGEDRVRHFPTSPDLQARAVPVYETIEGWKSVTRGAKSWADLPAQAIKYVRRIEELIETPVTTLSTGPEREESIMVHDPFRG